MGDLATLIRDARESKGLSLSEAAKRIGIAKMHLWQIEVGRATNPTLKVAAGIRRVLGVSAKKLLDAAENDNG
jgi:transcriptional regulator with XRE-family HTH domain